MSENQNVATAKPQPATVQVSISRVLELLAEGKDRVEIGKILGLKAADRNRLFKHKLLKGKKVHRPRTGTILDIIDDVTPKTDGEQAQNTQSEGQEPAPPQPQQGTGSTNWGG